MNFRQINDVVKWSAEFHADLGRVYAQLGTQSQDTRVKETLRYLADHEAEIERGLRGHLNDADPALTGGWVRGEVSPDKLQLLLDLRSQANANSVDAVMERAVDIHNALEALYGELVGYAELPASQELLKNLCEHENAETRRMVRDIGWYEST